MKNLKTFIHQWNHYIANSCHLERGKQDFVEYAAGIILGPELKSKFYEALNTSRFANSKLEITDPTKFSMELQETDNMISCYMITSLFDDKEVSIVRAKDNMVIEVIGFQRAEHIDHKNGHFLWPNPVKA